jgi:uncharacterized membrane protein
MKTISGLPAHPFLVHIPIVLLPLAAIGTVALVARQTWYVKFRWVVLVIGAIGAAGAVLAASAGEQLQETLSSGDQGSIEHHAELGDTAKAVAVLFVVLLAAYVVIPWVLARRAGGGTRGNGNAHTGSAAPRWLMPTLGALALVAALGSTITVIQAGHSGAKSVWNEQEGGVQEGGDGGQGGEGGDGDDRIQLPVELPQHAPFLAPVAQ